MSKVKEKAKKPITKNINVNDGSRTRVIREGKDVTPEPPSTKAATKAEGGSDAK